MTNIDIAKTILKYVGQDSIEVDRALCQGVILLLETEENAPEPDRKIVPKQEKAEQKAPKQTTRKKSSFDVGKLAALWKAGWSVQKIADEMGVSEPTVYKYPKQIGAKEKVKNEQTGSV